MKAGLVIKSTCQLTNVEQDVQYRLDVFPNNKRVNTFLNLNNFLVQSMMIISVLNYF